MNGLLHRAHLLLVGAALLLSLASCRKEENGEVAGQAQETMREWLSGNFVIWTHAKMNGELKTVADDRGCPVLFEFEWKEGDDEHFIFNLRRFSVGKMPLHVTFRVECDLMTVPSFKQDVYPGGDWVMFKGKDGVTTSDDNVTAVHNEKSGAYCEGFYNIKTHGFYVFVNYNMLNVTTTSPKQVLDKSLTPRYKELHADYERRLKQWQKEHPES